MDYKLTPAAQALLDHLQAGGTVQRDVSAPEGKGFSAEGIKLLLPATVRRLRDLQFLVLDEIGEDTETWTLGPGPRKVNAKAIQAMLDEPVPTMREATAKAEAAKAEVLEARKAKEQAAKPPKETKAEAPKEAKPVDILMWVGSQHYPTIDHFVAEAREHGVSKRVGKLPRDLVPGKSRIFLAHDEGQIGEAVIFGYATITDLEVLIQRVHGSSEREDVKVVTAEMLEDEAERGCGFREVPGAMYVAAYGSNPLKVFKEPISYNATIETSAKRFRSYKRVDGDKLLASEDRTVRPQERARTEIDMPELKGIEVSAEGRWSPEMREALRQVIARYGSVAQALRDFALVTGRSPEGVAYQYHHNLRRAERQEEEA